MSSYGFHDVSSCIGLGENNSSDTIEFGFTLLLMRENNLCYNMLP